jgi:pimeloyl-ACP methyl ester carboxylesterase
MKNTPALIPFLIVLAAISACNSPSKNPPSGTLKTQNNGVNIAYTDTGNSDTTLLFVHGWCINKTYFTDQVDAFSKRYRVVTIDLPGFGQSGKNRTSWTVGDFGKDVTSVITQLDLKHVILIGHSMSGAIVVQAKLDAPDKVIGLIGIDNFKEYSTEPETPEYKAAFGAVISALKKNFKKAATDYFNQYLFYKTTDSALRKRILNDVTHTDSTVAIACLEDNNSFNTAARLKEAKMKIHLINSDNTPNDTTGFIKNNIPYQLLIIHTTGHFPMAEKPNEFNILLQKAINDIK